VNRTIVSCRTTVLIAVLGSGFACAKKGDALVVVTLNATNLIEHIGSFRVEVTESLPDGGKRRDDVEYPAGDLGVTLSALQTSNLGLTLPRGTNAVTLAVTAQDMQGRPLASGTTPAPLIPIAGARIDTTVTLAPTRTEIGDGGADTDLTPDSAQQSDGDADMATGLPDAPDRPPAEPSKCPGRFLLCEGMERDTPVLPGWHLFASPAGALATTLVIDKTQAARGNSSLLVHVDADKEVSAGMFWTAGALDEYYVRFFLLMPKGPPGNGYVSIEGDQDVVSANWSESDIGLSGTHQMPGSPSVNLLAAPPAMAMIPRDRWVCVILHVAPQAVSVFVEDEVTAALTSPLVQPAKLRDVYFRFYSDRRSSSRPLDMWIDEIAIDDSPIHCAN
jgi:hypothetical protein